MFFPQKCYIDLHVHSNYSDGQFSPRELVERALKRKISVLSITDHDTVDGVEEALQAGNDLGIEIIPGVELSVQYEPGSMHMLGYFINHHDEALRKQLKELQEVREQRNVLMVRKLNQLGVAVTIEEVRRVAGQDQIGRPHFATVLIEKGVVKNFEEAFSHFLAKGKAAYVDKKRLGPEEAIKLIRSAGGLAVLAHPKSLWVKSVEKLNELIAGLVTNGLDGLEVYSSAHNGKDSKKYRRLALEHDLFVTGGSDFHGNHHSTAELGILGVCRMNSNVVREMRDHLSN